MNKSFPHKDDPLDVLLTAMVTGDTSKAITDSEARGQRELVNSTVLPKKLIQCTREQFEKMGIVFGEDADDIFVYVTLPPGWNKAPDKHSMWSHLLDDKDRRRASIFYKAAFYDRSAHMSICRRYSFSAYMYADRDGNIIEYPEKGDPPCFATWILDDEKPIKLIDVRTYKYGGTESDKCEKLAYAWLQEHYPLHNDPLAYWD